MTNTAEDVALLPPDSKIDIFDLFLRFLRRLPIFLLVAVAIMAGVVAYTMTRVPTYAAVASVVIEPRRTEVLKETPVVSDLPTESEAIDTEALVLNSEQLAERVVRRLSLQNDPEFNPPPDPDQPPVPSALSPQEQGILNAVKAVQGNTDVRRSGLTYVIEVEFTSLDPAKAATIANALVEEYVASQIETNVDATRGASAWLQSRLQSLQRELQTNEAAVQQYTIANGLMSTSGATMAEQEVSTLNQQIAVAAADLAEKRARLAAARQQMARGGGGTDVAAVQESQTVRDLRRKQAENTVELAQLQNRYGPLHPDVRKLNDEQRAIDLEITGEIRRVLSALEAEVRVSEQRYASLVSSRGRSEGSLSANTRSKVALGELQRKADASRLVYEAFLNRAKETTAQEGLQRPDAKISARARPPTRPATPNKPINYALGLIAAFAGGGGVVMLLETLDATMRTAADVRYKLKMNTIGSIPLLPKMSSRQASRVVVDKPFSSFSEAFRSLKSSIWSATKDKTRRVIAITSALPSEGKTLTTLSFGRSLARGGAKTLVIDADLRRRMLTAATGLQVKHGLVEVLEGRVALDRVLVHDDVSGAYLLLLSDHPPPETDLFDGPGLPALFQMLKDELKFDVIVIDTAPVLAIADVRSIVAKADVTVPVVRWAKTPKHATKVALELLASAGAYVPGICLTLVDMSKQAQLTYGEASSYSSAFKKYYTE